MNPLPHVCSAVRNAIPQRLVSSNNIAFTSANRIGGKLSRIQILGTSELLSEHCMRSYREKAFKVYFDTGASIMRLPVWSILAESL